MRLRSELFGTRAKKVPAEFGGGFTFIPNSCSLAAPVSELLAEESEIQSCIKLFALPYTEWNIKECIETAAIFRFGSE